MKPSRFWLEQAQSAFMIGKTPVIRDGDPRRLHRRLYKAAKVRGYNWNFAQDGKGGVVVKYEHESASKRKNTHGN